MKRNPTYILTLIILISFNQFISPQNGWEVLNSPTSELLRNLSAVDENYIWAAGTNGTIIRTTNGGENWSILNTGVTTAIYDIIFLNRNQGWAVTFPFDPPYYTRILRTIDGGDNWEIIQYPDEFVQFRTIHFLDSLNGFIGGARIERTTDGGYTWNAVTVDSSAVSDYPVIRFKFYDNQLGFASGGQRDQAGVMWRTSDGGLNWAAAGISPDEIYDFHILDSMNVVGLSGDPEWIYPTEIVRTTNAGVEWTSVSTPHYALSFALEFRKPNEGWSASGYFFLLTTDAGESWDTVYTPDQTAILDLQFINDTIGFACGQDGALLKYVGSTVNVINEITPVSQFKLVQNYPNPFNPITIIKWQTPISSHNLIKVYDFLGNEVATLVNEYRQMGDHEITFNADKLSSGVYFYTLSADGFFQSKKMLLIR